MQVIFDNIIYSLQQFGGISVVWNEILKRAVSDASFQKLYLEYPHKDGSAPHAFLPTEDILTPAYRTLERYRSPHYAAPTEPTLFHSSYFRTLPKKNVLNITTVHDLTYHFYVQGLPRLVHLWQEKQAVSRSTGIICVSENTKIDLLRFYPFLNEANIRVIYNGVDSIFTPIATIPDSELPFEPYSYLLFVGNRKTTYKNFNTAVQVAAATHLPLVFVGESLTSQEESYLNEQLGTHWKNYVHSTREQLNLLYNRAFCLLYPSDYEGFGLPIIEAQRAHCPVIAQAISSIPEVAADAAILVPAEKDKQALAASIIEAVNGLKSGQLSRETLIEQGEQNAGRFSWDNTYQQTKQFYQDIYHQ